MKTPLRDSAAEDFVNEQNRNNRSIADQLNAFMQRPNKVSGPCPDHSFGNAKTADDARYAAGDILDKAHKDIQAIFEGMGIVESKREQWWD